MNTSKNICRRQTPRSSGFTLLEVLIAVVILTISAVALLGLFSQTVVLMQYSKNDLIARQKAHEALEMIMSAKTTGQLGWTAPTDTLENSGTNQGVFLTGWQPMNSPCSLTYGSALAANAAGYGLVGTCSDSQVDFYKIPDRNGSMGSTAQTVPLANFQRQIQINTVTIAGQSDPSLRLIQVSVRYPQSPTGYRVYNVNSYVSQFQ